MSKAMDIMIKTFHKIKPTKQFFPPMFGWDSYMGDAEVIMNTNKAGLRKMLKRLESKMESLIC